MWIVLWNSLQLKQKLQKIAALHTRLSSSSQKSVTLLSNCWTTSQVPSICFSPRTPLEASYLNQFLVFSLHLLLLIIYMSLDTVYLSHVAGQKFQIHFDIPLDPSVCSGYHWIQLLLRVSGQATPPSDWHHREWSEQEQLLFKKNFWAINRSHNSIFKGFVFNQNKNILIIPIKMS